MHPVTHSGKAADVRRGRSSWYRLAAVGLVCAGLLWLFLPWRGDIRRFDPDKVAKLESDMWRHYYEKRFGLLALDLFGGVRENYRVSPWDAGMMAWDAAMAARVFQASTSRESAGQAIPLLEKCYNRLARATNTTFDAHRAAVLELEWWQQRRELVPPGEYAQTIALLACEIYSIRPDPRIDAAAQARAEAMAFRDAHRRSSMTAADWDTVTETLTRSYRLLYEAAVGRPGSGTEQGKG